MCIEDLKKAVAEAKEADLFASSPTDPDEPETDQTEEKEIHHYPCNGCKYYDVYIYDCKLNHCPYVEDPGDDLEGQQYLY